MLLTSRYALILLILYSVSCSITKSCVSGRRREPRCSGTCKGGGGSSEARDNLHMGVQAPPGCDTVCCHTSSPYTPTYQNVGGWFSQAQLCLLYLVLVALLSSSAGKFINTFFTFIWRFKSKNVIFKLFYRRYTNSEIPGLRIVSILLCKILRKNPADLLFDRKNNIGLLALIPKACFVAKN